MCGVGVGDDGVHTELLGPGGRVLAAEVVLVNLHRHVLLHLLITIYLFRSKLELHLILRQHGELQDRVHELLCLLYPLDVAVHLVTLVTVNLLAPVTV